MELESLPLVSIRIPAYNHEKFINQCLDSVLFDDYPNKELVVIDDGSTDETASMIEDWINKNKPEFGVRFYPREHRGLSPTLNELISLCEGDFLVSLASDDVLIPGGIRSRVDYLMNNPKKSAVFSDCMVIDDNDTVTHASALTELYSSSIESYSEDNLLSREIIWNWSIPGPVLMVRRTIYEKTGYYNPKLLIEDWDFYLKMCSQNLLGFINEKVSYYRLHESNTSRPKNNAMNLVRLAGTAQKNISGFQGELRRLLIKKMFILLFLSLKEYPRRFKKH